MLKKLVLFLVLLALFPRLGVSGSTLLSAKILMSRGDFTSAEEAFRELLAQTKGSREFSLGLVSALKGGGKNKAALETLNRYLLEVDPFDVEARMLVVDLHLAESNPTQAKAEIDRIALLSPKRNGLNEKSAQVELALGNKERSVKLLEEASKSESLSSESSLVLARLYIGENDLYAADKVLARHQESFAPSAESFFLRGTVREAQKRSNEAEIFLRKAIQIEPSKKEYWLAYSEFLLRMDRKSESMRVLKNALALDAANPLALKQLAALSEAQGDFEGASIAFAKLLSVLPSNDDAMFGLLRMEEKRNSMDKVGKYLKDWVITYPDKTWISLSYARMLVALGIADQARELLIAKLDRNPNQSELRTYLSRLSGDDQSIESTIVSNSIEMPASVADEGRKPANLTAHVYEVRRGDTLSDISRAVYGTSTKWRLIFGANVHQLRKPTDLMPGMKLTVPDSNEEKSSDNREEKFREGSRVLMRFVGDLASAGHRMMNRALSLILPAEARAEAEVPVRNKASGLRGKEREANSASSFLVDPHSIQLPEIIPEQVEGKTELVDRVEIPETQRPSRFHGVVGIGPVMESLKLEGSGFNSEIPGKLGWAASGGAEFQSELPVDFGLNLMFSKTSLDGLSGVTPGAVKLDRRNASVFCRLYPFPQIERMSLRVGYQWTKRSVTETSPRAVVTNRSLSGALLGAGYKKPAGEIYTIESDFEVFLANSFAESGAKTGFYQSGFAAQLKMGAARDIRPGLSAALALQIQMEQTKFNGTGSRGVTNGKEKDWAFSLPLQLRF